MSNKDANKEEIVEPAEAEEPSKQPKQQFPLKQEESDPHIEYLMWKGIIPVYKCSECGHQEEDIDTMILHIVEEHVEPNKQQAYMNKLIKEKK